MFPDNVKSAGSRWCTRNATSYNWVINHSTYYSRYCCFNCSSTGANTRLTYGLFLKLSDRNILTHTFRRVFDISQTTSLIWTKFDAKISKMPPKNIGESTYFTYHVYMDLTNPISLCNKQSKDPQITKWFGYARTWFTLFYWFPKPAIYL